MVRIWNYNCSEEIQNYNDHLIFQSFERMPCATLLLYLKLKRKEILGTESETADMVDLFANDDVRQGPEDIFVKSGLPLKLHIAVPIQRNS